MIYARFWIDAAIEAGASHINNAMNFGFNRALQREQNEWNERMAGMANQWNIEQWERENEYNLPVNQVARLQAAGINPALAMGQGASAMISGQQADAIHPANVPQGTQPPYLPYSEPKLNLLAEQLTKAQIREIDSKISTYESERLNLLQSIDESKERVKNLQANTDLMNQQGVAAALASEANWLDTMSTIANRDKDTQLKQSEIDSYVAQAEHLRAASKQLIENADYLHQLTINAREEEKRNKIEFNQKHAGMTPEQVARKNQVEYLKLLYEAQDAIDKMKYAHDNKELIQAIQKVNTLLEPIYKVYGMASGVAGAIAKFE